MSDLPDLSSVIGTPLAPEQIQGILAQIDLDILNLLRDGKLAALKYDIPGGGGRGTDRAANLQALLAARDHYTRLLNNTPTCEVSHYLDD